MSQLRNDALAIWNAGLDSVRARTLLRSQVSIDDSCPDELVIADDVFDRSDFDRILIVGAGKATAAMTAGLCDKISGWLPIEGWINVPGKPVDLSSAADLDIESIPSEVTVYEARPATVNEPRSEGVAGTEQILKRVAEASQRDLCIALISGGGSALLPAPKDGITLADKLAVIRKLSESGAGIGELNTVRKHLSRVKGGGLLRMCRAGRLLTLVLSDVLGDPIDLIASGPTVEDTTTQTDALKVLDRFDPNRELPAPVYKLLEREPQPLSAITTRATTIVIGNNAVAVDEAGIVAERLGYNHIMHCALRCEPSAEEVGHKHAEMLVGMLRSRETHRVNCFITGGEPVVTLVPIDQRGLGGRNQQLVLAAYARLLEYSLSQHEWDRIAMLSAGTDGEDGPTDAAGAMLDHHVHRLACEKRLCAGEYLSRNDAYHFFEQTGGLIKTGPTGTNVCDLRVGVVDCLFSEPLV